MQIEIESNCPIAGFTECKKTACSWFTKVRGTNPNTGQEVDEYGCAVAWLPVLLIENAQQNRQTGAAVESFRNEVTKTQKEGMDALAYHFDRASKGEPTFRTLQQAVIQDTEEVTE